MAFHRPLAALILAATAHTQAGDTLYQSSTIDALLAGIYAGPTTIAEARTHGGFGLGTVDHLDGELVALDGIFYQITADRQVHRLADDVRVPFIALTHFAADTTRTLAAPCDDDSLKAQLDDWLSSKNFFTAIRVDGRFARVKLRSVPPQSPPYRPLTEVVKAQTEWELTDVEGTLVGFRCPEFASGVNVPGYHFHFITTDRTEGGHVLDLEVTEATAQLDTLRRLELDLPDDPAFRNTPLGPTSAESIEGVERGQK